MKTRWIMMAGLVGLCGMAQSAMVTISDPGNMADPANGGTYGDVAYTYRISATEVTIAEFTASGVGSGNENYWQSTVGTAAPASYVSLYEAKKYANYLTTQANGGSTAYNLYSADGTGAGSYTRADAISDGILVYALPTEDEWYKAAYYTGNSGDLWSLYANGTDTAPGVETDSNYGGAGGTYPGTWVVGTGTAEQNGTYDMMGNVWEWMEASSGMLRGGSYSGSEGDLRSSYRYGYDPSNQSSVVGFRVVAIPEPATALLLAIGGCIVWLARLKQRF